MITFGSVNNSAAKQQRAQLLEELSRQPRVFEALLREASLKEDQFTRHSTPETLSTRLLGEGSSGYATRIAAQFLQAVAPQLTWQTWTPPQVEAHLQAMQAYGIATTPLPKNTQHVVISQSGKSSNVLNALQALRVLKAQVVSNNPQEILGKRYGSSQYPPIGLGAGDEKSVPATTSMTSSILASMLYGIAQAQQANALSAGQAQQARDLLAPIPRAVQQLLTHSQTQPMLSALARDLANSNLFILLSRGPLSVVLDEAALKLRESSRNVALADNSDSFKHGPSPMLAGVWQGKQKPILPHVLYVVPPDAQQAQLLYEDVIAHYRKDGIQLFDASQVHFLRTGSAPPVPQQVWEALSLNSKTAQHEWVLPGTTQVKTPVEAQFVWLAAFHLLCHSLAAARDVSPNDPALSKAVIETSKTT